MYSKICLIEFVWGFKCGMMICPDKTDFSDLLYQVSGEKAGPTKIKNEEIRAYKS